MGIGQNDDSRKDRGEVAPGAAAPLLAGAQLTAGGIRPDLVPARIAVVFALSGSDAMSAYWRSKIALATRVFSNIRGSRSSNYQWIEILNAAIVRIAPPARKRRSLGERRNSTRK